VTPAVRAMLANYKPEPDGTEPYPDPGNFAAKVRACLSELPAGERRIARHLGWAPHEARAVLRELRHDGLAEHVPGGWVKT